MNEVQINDFFNEQFLSFNQFEFVNYERLFQNVLYLVEIDNESINYPHTNKLDWKKARKFWNKELIEGLKSYQPFGPKPKEVSFFSKVNRILEIFETFNLNHLDEIREYNYVLAKTVEFIVNSKLNNVTYSYILVLTLRKEDVMRRKRAFYEYEENRKSLINKKTLRAEQMEEELKTAKLQWEEEKQNKQTEPNQHDKADKEDSLVKSDENQEVVEDGFNEENWIRNWENDKSIIEIPDEKEEDIDNDIMIPLEAIINFQ